MLQRFITCYASLDPKEISIFLSLPGDLGKDFYQVINEIITELNRILDSLKLDLSFKLIYWEKSTKPSVGTEPQNVINKHTDEYDIFTGILWTRFGTPTKKYDSGTQEEFEIALDKFKKGEIIELLLYFRTDSPKSLKNIDTVQLEKVEDFKKEVSDKGALYHEFENTDYFKTEYKIHLCKAIEPILRERGKSYKGKTSELDNQELTDIGYIELTQKAVSQFQAMTNTILSMSNEIEILGNKMGDKSIELEKINNQGNRNKLNDEKLLLKAILIIKEVSESMKKFSDKMETLIPVYRNQYTEAFGAYSKLMTIAITYDLIQNDQYLEIKKKVTELIKGMEYALDSCRNFHKTIQSIPDITTDFMLSKSRANKVLEELVNDLEQALSLAKGILE